MRCRLIGDVAHELRTPLTTIKGSVEGLEDGILPASKETYALISHEANRMKRLVDDLQEVSRVEAGAYTLDPHSISLRDVVDVALKRLAPAYKKKGVEYHLDFPDDLPQIMGDMDRLLQVMMNLLHNALIYTPAGGLVSLTAGVLNNEILVSITDTGIGITQENQPYIFDRFYRVDKARSHRSDGGSGIGLTIAKHLVEAHHGRIWAESKGLDQGSTFLFTLPIGSQI
jgi:histidine kinase